MACRFVKVSEEEIEEVFLYPSDLVNTTYYILRISAYIHHYSPPLQGIVVYCYKCIHYYELFIFLNECIVASSLRLFKANETNYENKLESHLPGGRLAGYHVQAQQESWTRNHLKQIWASAQGGTWTQDIRISSLAPEPLCHTTSLMNLYLIAWPLVSEVLQCQWSTAQGTKRK